MSLFPVQRSQSRWKWWEILALGILVCLLTVWQNHDFTTYAYIVDQRFDPHRLPDARDRAFHATDEYFLLQGYYRFPNLWWDGLAWWHGTWIHQYTHFFRPLSSYLHWAHVHIVLTYGSVWLGWLGTVLFCVGCGVAALVAWQITRAKAATVLATLVLPFSSVFNSAQPGYWLAWFRFTRI